MDTLNIEDVASTTKINMDKISIILENLSSQVIVLIKVLFFIVVNLYYSAKIVHRFKKNNKYLLIFDKYLLF